ncbi:MAG: ABC transporter ATP-binding protein [Methylorubrum populi]
MLTLARDLGITVVAVLHDLTLVSLFADRVAVLCNGRIAVHADPHEALSPRIVRDVFAMDCFSFANPRTGRSLLAFDAPAA